MSLKTEKRLASCSSTENSLHVREREQYVLDMKRSSSAQGVSYDHILNLIAYINDESLGSCGKVQRERVSGDWKN